MSNPISKFIKIISLSSLKFGPKSAKLSPLIWVKIVLSCPKLVSFFRKIIKARAKESERQYLNPDSLELPQFRLNFQKKGELYLNYEFKSRPFFLINQWKNSKLAKNPTYLGPEGKSYYDFFSIFASNLI